MFCTACGTGLPEAAKFCGRCGSEVQPIPDRPLAPLVDRPCYASFWRRVAACMLDGFVLWIPGTLVFMALLLAFGAFAQPGAPPPGLGRAMFIAYAGLWTMHWLYFALMHSSKWQATLGKQAVGIKVTSLTGERITFLRASLRFLGNVLEIFTLGIGPMMAAVTRRRQALHDIVGGTLVTSAATTPDDVRRGLHAQPIPKGLVAVTLGTPALLFGSMLAMMAIPAYESYKVRRQVYADSELAETYRDEVAASLAAGTLVGEIDNARIDLPELVEAKYLEMIEVRGGLVRLWYSENADPSLRRLVLTFTPAFDERGELTWLCGYAPAPPGVTPVEEEYQEFTTLPLHTLPQECR
jgi:Predicted membrane protein/domain